MSMEWQSGRSGQFPLICILIIFLISPRNLPEIDRNSPHRPATDFFNRQEWHFVGVLYV